MNAPDKIYAAFMNGQPIGISVHKLISLPHAYIRRDALLEWLRKEADKSFNSFAREELGLEARYRGLDFEEVIAKIKSL